MAFTSPSDVDLVRLANIVTGRYLTPEQKLPQGHRTVKLLDTYLRWLHSHLAFYNTAQLDAINWFQAIITFFSNHPNGQINTFVDEYHRKHPTDQRSNDLMRSHTLACLSYWLTIEVLHKVLDSIEETSDTIKYCVADLHSPTEENKTVRSEGDIRSGKISLKELVYNGRLIPRAEKYTDPLKAINAKALNVHQLVKFGRLKVKWTTDLSRHLELVEEDKHLYIFCMPCIFAVQTGFSSTQAVQGFRDCIPDEYTDEIRRSYWLLFGNSRKGRRSFKRAIKSDKDIDVKVSDESILMEWSTSRNQKDTVWDREKFIYLWPRIIELKSHLDGSQPESWWGLIWHDRSQPYIFVPAIISGILFLLAIASTGATIAQTWKTFHP